MKKRVIYAGIVFFMLLLMLVYSPISTDEKETGEKWSEKEELQRRGSVEEQSTMDILYPETSREAFLALIQQETEEPVCDLFYEDFEGNGEYSAFIFTGDKEGEGSLVEFTGSLWYANREGVLLLEEGIETYDYEPTVLTWGEEKHLLFIRSAGIGYVESFFWKVEKNEPLLVESLLCSCYLSGGDLVAVSSFPSEEGRIWLKGCLYWDEQEKCYREYIGEQALEKGYPDYGNVWQLAGRSVEKETSKEGEEIEDYLSAYKEYLLSLTKDPEEFFPIRGYCLVDLNFDLVPELGIYHDSMGSMGAWFAYYGFDGNEVVSLFQTSAYTQILADPEDREVFLFREMYLLIGNDNGLVGYISRLGQENGMVTYEPLLSLQVDENKVIEAERELKREFPDYSTEDEYLADDTMDEYFLTEYWNQGSWKEISSAEYLKRKRELIPDKNELVDLRERIVYFLAVDQEVDAEELYGPENWLPTEEELHRFFEEWRKGRTS